MHIFPDLCLLFLTLKPEHHFAKVGTMLIVMTLVCVKLKSEINIVSSGGIDENSVWNYAPTVKCKTP